MTEKAAGADATGMQTRAERKGNDAMCSTARSGFRRAASVADIALVMAKTDPDAPRHQQFTTFLVELPNPGYSIMRNIPTMALEGPLSHILGGGHAEIEIKDLEVPAENLLGGEGNGFNMGQHRLAYGRLRHGMHNVAMAQRALDMATAARHRALDLRQEARRAPGRAVHARRLREPALHRPPDAPAHRLQGGERHGPAPGERHRQGLPRQHGAQGGRHGDPAARRARLQQDTPLAAWYTHIRSQRLVDGPDEVHNWTTGRNVIKAYKATGTTAGACGGDLL